MSADERVPSWTPDAPISKIRQHCLAPSDATSDEYRNAGEVRQDLLGQDPGGNRSDMPACLVAFDHDRIDAACGRATREAEGGCKTEDARSALLNSTDRRSPRKPAGEHDMADVMGRTDVDQLDKLRVKGDQIDPKRTVVIAWVAWISSDSCSGDMDPEAMTPKPPASEIAATRLRSDTQVIAPPMMARSQPRTSRPRAHKRSSSASRRSRLSPADGRRLRRLKIRCADALDHPAASSP